MSRGSRRVRTVVGWFRLAVLGAVVVIAAPAASNPVITWDEALQRWRGGQAHGPVAVYIGAHDSTFMHRIADGTFDTSGVPVIAIAAEDRLTNPFTDRAIVGADFIKLWAALIQGPPAGSLYFLDEQAVPIPLLVLPHGIHRNRADVIHLYCRYAAEGMYGRMSLADFGRVIGMETVVLDLTSETTSGYVTGLGYLMRNIDPADHPMTAVMDDGTTVTPATHSGCFHVITADPRGPVFRAVMREIWTKLSLRRPDGTWQRPPIIVIGPVSADRAGYQDLQLEGIQFQAAVAPRIDIEAGASPRIIMSGGAAKDAKAIEVSGFMPGDAIGNLIGIPVEDIRPMHPDIPLGDIDSGRVPTEHGGR